MSEVGDKWADIPLHGLKLLPGMWWACDEPERPYDPGESFDQRCPRCLIKAQADLAVSGDHPMMDPLKMNAKSPLSDLVREDDKPR